MRRKACVSFDDLGKVVDFTAMSDTHSILDSHQLLRAPGSGCTV